MKRMKKRPVFPIFALMLTLLSACAKISLPSGEPLPALLGFATPTRTPFLPLPITPTPAPPTPTFTPEPPQGVFLWADSLLPAALLQSLALPVDIFPAAQPDQAALRLEVGDQHPVSRWVYALVAPFPDLPQGVSSEEVQRSWRGERAGPYGAQPLLVDESTLAVFSALWGAPAEGAVLPLPAADLLTYAWEHRPAWALVPFEALDPRWKVLQVDGQSPLWKSFDPAGYPLTAPVSLNGETALVEAVLALYGPQAPSPLLASSNRDPGKLTTVALTGVTALVRATAYTMEQRGVKYPGKDVRDWLLEADVTHISNEVPFARNCPFPNPVQPDVRFCSDPRYIELMEDVGADIVELTGDHFQDWGEEAMLYTLDLYKERGWLYYGGGANLEEGRQAAIIEHNGNRLAFIGCNGKGGGFAQASANHPGAVVCDYAWMQAEIARLRAEGYLPIATFQHFEYYTYQAQPNQERDFRGVAQAGAVVVSGSQAHQPQALEFVGSSLIHYGLGNLFFDQYDVSQACRQAFIDRHVFYNGRYIGTELLPILFVDYARARPMDPGEREDLLHKVFAASGW